MKTLVTLMFLSSVLSCRVCVAPGSNVQSLFLLRSGKSYKYKEVFEYYNKWNVPKFTMDLKNQHIFKSEVDFKSSEVTKFLNPYYSKISQTVEIRNTTYQIPMLKYFMGSFHETIVLISEDTDGESLINLLKVLLNYSRNFKIIVIFLDRDVNLKFLQQLHYNKFSKVLAVEWTSGRSFTYKIYQEFKL